MCYNADKKSKRVGNSMKKLTPEQKKKIAAVWDKVTTGLLILLMAAPVLILAYIFIWFLSK